MVCGRIIPEGRQVCYVCEHAGIGTKRKGEQSKMSWIWWTLVAIIGANVIFFGFLVVKMILDERRPKE